MHNIPEHATEKTTFIGKVSHPFSSPTITRGYVEFKVQPVQRGPLLPGSLASLISHSGETYHVTIRGIGRVTPNASIPNAWSPGDFLVAVYGITIDQADEMRLLQNVIDSIFKCYLFNMVSFIREPHELSHQQAKPTRS